MTDDRKRKTGGEVELLPLPEPMQMTWEGPEGYDDEMMESYARANVDRALAESRAEVAENAASARLLSVERAEFRIRAERLAEALRELVALGHPNDPPIIAARAALNLEPNP